MKVMSFTTLVWEHVHEMDMGVWDLGSYLQQKHIKLFILQDWNKVDQVIFYLVPFLKYTLLS